MRKALLVIWLAALAFGLAGCEDYDENPLHFENLSTYHVTVESLSSEWVGFVLAPDEEKKMSGIRNIDYSYSPKGRVGLGTASKARYIIFVNLDSETIESNIESENAEANAE